MRERLETRIPRWFIGSSGALLMVTGIGKVWSGLGSAKYLALADPIIGIRLGHLMLLVGVAEIVIASLCFASKRPAIPLALIAWISVNFILYRFGLWSMNWHRPCRCMGNLTDALHISPTLADNVLKAVLAYLLIGSFLTLAWLWRRRRTRKQPIGAT
jgi:hypothetical protein